MLAWHGDGTPRMDRKGRAMTPKAKAREKIDHQLAQAGWLVQDLKLLKTDAARTRAKKKVSP